MQIQHYPSTSVLETRRSFAYAARPAAATTVFIEREKSLRQSVLKEFMGGDNMKCIHSLSIYSMTSPLLRHQREPTKGHVKSHGVKSGAPGG